MNKIIYVLGNDVEISDRMPITILPFLKKKFPHVSFVLFDPTEEFAPSLDKDLLFIDTVINISKVALFEGIAEWQRSPAVSVHDYDLLISLTLMQKLGKIHSVRIIAVPPKGNKAKIISEVSSLLASILS
jgi:hypothetical protein